jgi:hypothetical protein
MNAGKNYFAAIDNTPIEWEGIKKGSYTCEIGSLPNHWENIPQCLEKYYADNLKLFFKTDLP